MDVTPTTACERRPDVPARPGQLAGDGRLGALRQRGPGLLNLEGRQVGQADAPELQLLDQVLVQGLAAGQLDVVGLLVDVDPVGQLDLVALHHSFVLGEGLEQPVLLVAPAQRAAVLVDAVDAAPALDELPLGLGEGRVGDVALRDVDGAPDALAGARQLGNLVAGRRHVRHLDLVEVRAEPAVDRVGEAGDPVEAGVDHLEGALVEAGAEAACAAAQSVVQIRH